MTDIIKYKSDFLELLFKLFEKYFINKDELEFKSYLEYINKIRTFLVFDKDIIKRFDFNFKSESEIEEEFFRFFMDAIINNKNINNFDNLSFTSKKYRLVITVYNFIHFLKSNNFEIFPAIEVIPKNKNLNNDFLYIDKYFTFDNFDIDVSNIDEYIFIFLIKNENNIYEKHSIGIKFKINDNNNLDITINKHMSEINFKNLFDKEYFFIIRFYERYVNEFDNMFANLVKTILEKEVFNSKNLETHLLFKTIDFSDGYIIYKLYNFIAYRSLYLNRKATENVHFFLKEVINRIKKDY